MKVVVVTLFLLLSSAEAGEFTENTELWTSIDRVNDALDSGDPDSEALEVLFEETVRLALSSELSQQFEELRSDAYELNDFTLIDEYADRAGSAIDVFIMGESNNIGVNTAAFLDASKPETEAYSFFMVSIGGFYTDINYWIGIADFPAWRVRAGSSSQGRTVPEKALEWLGYWESVRPSLDGYFLLTADATILRLNDFLD